MSIQTAHRALTRMNREPAFLSPAYPAEFVARDLAALEASDYDREMAATGRRQMEILSGYGFDEQPPQQRKTFAFADGMAFVPVHGLLLNRFAYSWGYVTGYDAIRGQMRAALADPDVKAIVFDVNSPGGMAAGCMELADEIAKADKPTLAVVDAMACSAAYWLASGADRVVLTPSGQAGSIGCVVMHTNLATALKSDGVEITYVFAGQHKVDGNPYEVLSDSVKADIQRKVDKAYGDFVRGVAQNRGISEKAVRDTEAQVYDAEDALKNKLVDAVQPAGDAVLSWANEQFGSDNEAESDSMADAKTPETPAIDAAAIVAAERTRVNEILNSAEAEGREVLARALATESDMPATAAIAMLAKAEKKAAVVAPKTSAFAAAMDAGHHPNVGDGGEVGAPQEDKGGNRLMASLTAMGFKPDADAA